MKSVRCKLRSNTGASITFALLLFLVCASLSAVVLVAATTSAGRMSKIAETDQAYYAVTSAADLICDTINDQSVSIITVEQGNTSTEYAFDRPMNQIRNADIGLGKDTVTNSDDTDTAINTENKSDTASDFTENLALLCVGDTTSGTTTLSSSLSDDISEDPLAVNIVYSLEDSNLALTISNYNGSDKYNMMLLFGTDVVAASPAVTKQSGIEITSSYEVSWHLSKMTTPYDYSN